MSMALLAKLIAFGFGVIAFLIILINVLKGVLRGLKKTIATLVAVAMAAIVSAILTVILCSPSSALITALVSSLGDLIGGDLGEIMAIEELTTTFSYYTAMLIGPFFFLACYFLLNIIFAIIAAIIFKHLPILKNVNKVADRLGGLGLGLACGYIVAVIVLMPTVGTMSIVTSLPYDDLMNSGEVENEAEESEVEKYEMDKDDYYEDYYDDYYEGDPYAEEDEEIDEEMIDFMDDMNKYINVFMKSGCGPVYNAFASAKFNGERVYLKNDFNVIIALTEDISDAGNNIESPKLGDEHIDLFRSIVDNIEASSLLKNTVAGILSTACENWNSGEEFMGISKINAGDVMNPVTNELLNTLATTTYETVEGDLESMVDVFEILVHSGILDETEYDRMLIMLGEEDGVLDQLTVALHGNKRMDRVADEVAMISTRAMASHLNINTEEYDVLMNDIAASMNKYGAMAEAEKRTYVESDLKAAFDDYGVTVEGKAFDDIVDDIMEEFDGRTDVTNDEVSDYFQKHVIEEAEENGKDAA